MQILEMVQYPPKEIMNRLIWWEVYSADIAVHLKPNGLAIVMHAIQTILNYTG